MARKFEREDGERIFIGDIKNSFIHESLGAASNARGIVEDTSLECDDGVVRNLMEISKDADATVMLPSKLARGDYTVWHTTPKTQLPTKIDWHTRLGIEKGLEKKVRRGAGQKGEHHRGPKTTAQ
jgi:hypothetical protein